MSQGTLSLAGHTVVLGTNLSMSSANLATLIIGTGILNGATNTRSVSITNAAATITESTGILSASALTVSAGAYTLSGAGTVTVGGMTTVSGTGAVTLNAATVSTVGLTQSGGSINAGSSSISSSGSVTITAGNFTPGSSLLTMTTDATTVQVTGGSPANVLADLTIGTGGVPPAKTVTIFGNDLTLSGTLTVTANWIFGTGGQSLYVGGSVIVNATGGVLNGPPSSAQISVTGDTTVAGTINLNGGNYMTNNLSISGTGSFLASAAELITVKASLTMTGGTLDDTGATPTYTILVGANWSRSAGTTFNPRNGTVQFTNTGPGTGSISGPSSAETFYNLAKSGAGTVTFNSNLTIISSVTLSAGTLLNGGAYTIYLGDPLNLTPSPAFAPPASLGVVWQDSTPAGGVFSPGLGTVNFINSHVVVEGNNTFYDFLANTTSLGHAVTIYFQQGKTQTVTHTFNVIGTGVLATNTPINPVRLMSTISLDPSKAPGYDFLSPAYGSPPPPPNDSLISLGAPHYQQQWTLTVSGISTISWAEVQLSFATIAITPGPGSEDWHYNDSWFFVIPIMASWTVDTDNNGRIDRIRVQVQQGTQLSDVFGGLTVSVTGYTVSGFQGFGNKDVFDIKLQEGPQEDTSATPKWQLLANTGDPTMGTSLYGLNGTAKVEAGTKVYTAQDGARPVITYTAAALGSNKAYVHFSELVYGNAAASLPIGAGSLTYSNSGTPTTVPVQPVEMTGNGAHAAIVTLPSALAVADILSAPQTIWASPNAIWGAAAPTDPGTIAVPDYTNLDNNLPPNASRSMLNPSSLPLAAPAHNISDVGLGFATPVFALNTSVQRDPARGGVGMVTNFDGTRWLLPEDVLLEAKILVPALVLPTTTLSLFWDVNPPASLAFNNLWIPSAASTFWSPLTNLNGDRAHNPNTEAHTAAPAVNGALSDFRIPGTDADVKDGALLQFMFILDDGALPTPHRLPLAFPADPNNPGSIRPFEYSYHSIIAQRGNVTITNNVIHPANGESAYLHYVMPKTGKVSIIVFTLSGDIVNVLANGTQNAGEYATAWDGKNRGGRIVARGIYFIRVVGPGFDEFRKVLVVR